MLFEIYYKRSSFRDERILSTKSVFEMYYKEEEEEKKELFVVLILHIRKTSNS